MTPTLTRTDRIDFMLDRADGSSIRLTRVVNQDDYSLNDVVDLFRDFLLGAGYSPDSVREFLGVEP